ncbi:MAG: hypothetical protein WCS99_22485 [Limisphaerales bacterium]
MHLSSHQSRFSPTRFLVAVLMAFAVVTLGFLSVSPAAHACLHAQHDAADHDCVIQHFAQGKLLASDFEPALPVVALSELPADESPASVFLPHVSHLLPAGRAPPTV